MSPPFIAPVPNLPTVSCETLKNSSIGQKTKGDDPNSMKSPRFSRRPPILYFVAAACLPLGLSAADESPPSPRTHVLFMGADLSVQREKKLYRVVDVTGSEFKIRVNGEDVLVRTRLGAINLHV